MNIMTVPPERAVDFWPHIAPHIEKALEYSLTSMDEVLELVENSKAQCWFVVDGEKVIGAWVTRIEDSRTSRACLIWLAGGERLGEWLHKVPENVEPWAKELGCTEMQVVGRKGWAKRLPDYKWTSIVLRKEI